MPIILFPGSRVRGYTINNQLGPFGGQAVPYEGADAAGRRVFIKQFHTPTATSPDAEEFVQRQLALKDALSRIPAFVSVILDMFEDDGCFYQVAEWVEGTNLDQLFEEMGGNLDAEVRMLNAKVLAFSIQQIHAQGVAHLDLKPANVLMEQKDTGKSVASVFRIIDFDAAVVDGAPLPPKFLGTVPYHSPEHCDEGRGLVKPGKHSDVFTLGIMLYQLLANRYPYEGEWPECALRREATPLRELNPDIPPAVSELVWRALSPVAAERPTAAEIHQALLDAEAKSDRLHFRIGSTPFRKGAEFILGRGSEEFRGVRGVESLSKRQLRFYKSGGSGYWEVALLSERLPMVVNSEEVVCNVNNPPRRRLSRGDVIKVGPVEIVIDAL
jgi:serine/threonine protein kinase